jgi:adenylate cyclase
MSKTGESELMSLFNELKRRNVIRVGIAYAVVAWLVMQFADVVLNNITAPEWVFKSIMLLLAIGFPVVLVFAWAFEMTPEGIKREKDVDRTQSITPRTGKKLDRIIIAGLVLIIVGMGIERIWFAGQDEPAATQKAPEAGPAQAETSAVAATVEDTDHRESVAVLPFTAMSSGEDDGYFADGLTEEILNSLARLPELLVTARTSSFHFKDQNLPVPEIAATLGVKHVVEGSVRRSGERVRITAQLIRAEDGFHLWSQTYDRTLEDVFAVQEDIAENIAETLNVVLNEDKRKQMNDARIKDVEAFIAYQKGVEMMARAHSTSDPAELLPEANRYFDQALAIVPTITNAQLERTDLFGHIIYNNAIGAKSYTPAELHSALEEILTGLSQAARSAPSEAQRAYIEAERAEFSGDWSGIPANLDRAFQTDECFTLNWAASLAGVFGWAEQVSAHYERMVRCDPLSGLYVSMAAQFLLWAEPDKVVELTTHFLDEVAYQPWVDDMRFMALLASGKYHDAPGVYDPNPEGSYFTVPRKLFAYAMDNDIAKARDLLETTNKDTPVNDMDMLLVEAALGNREAANAYASRMDARFAGPFILAEAVKGCFCGAPFDLEATPNFKQRIEEAGFNWPPASPLKYPAKDW